MRQNMMRLIVPSLVEGMFICRKHVEDEVMNSSYLIKSKSHLADAMTENNFSYTISVEGYSKETIMWS